MKLLERQEEEPPEAIEKTVQELESAPIMDQILQETEEKVKKARIECLRGDKMVASEMNLRLEGLDQIPKSAPPTMKRTEVFNFPTPPSPPSSQIMMLTEAIRSQENGQVGMSAVQARDYLQVNYPDTKFDAYELFWVLSHKPDLFRRVRIPKGQGQGIQCTERARFVLNNQEESEDQKEDSTLVLGKIDSKDASRKRKVTFDEEPAKEYKIVRYFDPEGVEMTDDPNESNIMADVCIEGCENDPTVNYEWNDEDNTLMPPPVLPPAAIPLIPAASEEST